MYHYWIMTKPGRDSWIAHYEHVMLDALNDGWQAERKDVSYD